jgi:hypothetical protein
VAVNYMDASGQGAREDEGAAAATHGGVASRSGASGRRDGLLRSVEVAWVRTQKVGCYEASLVNDGLLVQARPEALVGSTQYPALLGMRVRLLDSMRFLKPIIFADSGGGPGTISWVSPLDPKGAGASGGVCQVIWDWTGVRECYRTGYKGDYNLRLVDALASRAHKELVLGDDVHAAEGQRVRVSSTARVLMPSLCRGCGPNWGCGTVKRVLNLETSAFARHLMLWNNEMERQRRETSNKAGTRQHELLIGIDLAPLLGQRVVLCRDARRTLMQQARRKEHSPSAPASPASPASPTSAARPCSDQPRLTTDAAASGHYFCGGTIVQVGVATRPGEKSPSGACPIGTVQVVWDNGCDAGCQVGGADAHSRQIGPQLYNVGRQGIFDLAMMRDQVMVGCSACPLREGLRVALCRRLLAHEQADAIADTGDGPGEIVRIIGWPPPPEPVQDRRRALETADTRVAGEGEDGSGSDEEEEDGGGGVEGTPSHGRSRLSTASSSRRSGRGTGGDSSSRRSGRGTGGDSSKGASAKGKDGKKGKNEAQESHEIPPCPVAGEVLVRWDQTGKEVVYKCGVDGEFSLALWQAGGNWEGHMCEVKWDLTGITSTFAYERGYEYKHAVGGLQTRQGHGVSNRIKPLVLAEEKPDVRGLLLHLVDAACDEVELEKKTQQKAATLMQKLARGVWGRRRIRRLRVVSSSREALRLFRSLAPARAAAEGSSLQALASHAAVGSRAAVGDGKIKLGAMLKRRQAFPPFSFQWRLLVLLHRFHETLTSSPTYLVALAQLPETVAKGARDGKLQRVPSIAANKIEDMRGCANVLEDDDLHANDKTQAVVLLTSLITNHDLVEQRRLQDAAVSMGFAYSLLEALMGIVASEPPEDESKAKGTWAAVLISNASLANVSKELEQAVQELQHAAALALAQLALDNRLACRALLSAGCMHVTALLLEKASSLPEHLAEAVVGIVNNVCVSCAIAPALAIDTCPGFLHDLVGLILPPRNDGYEGSEQDEDEEADAGASDDVHDDTKTVRIRQAHAAFRLPAQGQKPFDSSFPSKPLSSLQCVALMALSAISCRDASCRRVLSACGLTAVLEHILPQFTMLGKYAPDKAYSAIKWSYDRRLPEEVMAAYLYLSVKPSPPHPHSLVPAPPEDLAKTSDLALVILNAAHDWLSSFTELGGAGSGELMPATVKQDTGGTESMLKRVPSTQVSRAPSDALSRVGSGSSSRAWDVVRRASSIGKFKAERVASAPEISLAWTMPVIDEVEKRGPLPLTRAHPPILSLTRHSVVLEKERASQGFGRAGSGSRSSNAAFSRVASGHALKCTLTRYHDPYPRRWTPSRVHHPRTAVPTLCASSTRIV